MNLNKIVLFLFLSIFLIGGCSTTDLTPGGKAVIIAKEKTQVEGCELKGDVSATNVGEENTIMQVKNLAAELGGNFALITSGVKKGTLKYEMTAKAYLCASN